MNRCRAPWSVSAMAILVVAFFAGPLAQAARAAEPLAAGPQVTGVAGSPGATTTISGKQLPAPDPKFGGVIKENAMLRLEERYGKKGEAMTPANGPQGPLHGIKVIEMGIWPDIAALKEKGAIG